MEILEVNAQVVSICTCWSGLSGDAIRVAARPAAARSFDTLEFAY